MKIRFSTFFVIILFGIFNITICQSQEFANVTVDDGVSFERDSQAKNNLSIPLYTIEADGASIPIYLKYHLNSMRLSDLPSSVGFNWKLVAGGGVEKKINHLVDESPEGWFFNDLFTNYQAGNYLTSNIATANGWFKSVDACPDIFYMKMSNGDYIEYLHDRDNYLRAKIIQQNGSFNAQNITLDLGVLGQIKHEEEKYDVAYGDDLSSEIKIKNNNGVNYLFRRGIKRQRPYDFLRNSHYQGKDSLDYQNYYVHKIFTNFNTDTISFDYVRTKLNKLLLHNKASRVQKNYDPQTPPDPTDPIFTTGFYRDISVEDASRKEISVINFPKGRVEFIYRNSLYNNSFANVNFDTPPPHTYIDLQNQQINILEELKIFDHIGNYIMGYRFGYSEDLQGDDEGDLKLKYILRYGKNHKDPILYKKFDYYPYDSYRDSAVSSKDDVLGYPNGLSSNECDELPLLQGECFNNKFPDESKMIQGMLKSVTNTNGGITEYFYKENKYNNIYYGGLLVDKILKLNNNGNLVSKWVYSYEDPEGFGLPIYGQYPTNDMPSYEDGYYEPSMMLYPWWQTYFTRKDPLMELNNLSYLTAYNIEDRPYELMRNTPLLDTYISQYLNQDLNQISSGYFYKKITEKKLSIQTNLPELGYKISYYRPSLSGFHLGKKIKKIEFFNKAGQKVKQTNFMYVIPQSVDVLSAFKFENVHLNYMPENSFSYRFIVKNFNIFFLEDVLKSVENIEYNTANSIVKKTKTEFYFLNEYNPSQRDFTRITKKETSYNGDIFEKEEFKYLNEYNLPQNLLNLASQKPIVEHSLWKKSNSDWLLHSASIHSYLPDGKLKSLGKIVGNKNTGTFFTVGNYTPSHYSSSGNLISSADEFIQYFYDSNGKLKRERNSKTGISTILQRGDEYDENYVDAILTVSTNNTSFLKKSFENSDDPQHIEFSRAFSGKNVFSGNSIDLGYFPANYKVSFWYFKNNKWNYNFFEHLGGSLTVSKPSGAQYIDELRVQPISSVMQTMTFSPLFGNTSNLDENGNGERTEYDLFGKPLYSLDKKNNVIKEYRYNSQGIDVNN